MNVGFNILWTEHAFNELNNTIEYLKENWSDKEVSKLIAKLDHVLELISRNPDLFPESKIQPSIKKAVVLKYNTLYYRTKGKTVEILSFFSNRQSPSNRKV